MGALMNERISYLNVDDNYSRILIGYYKDTCIKMFFGYQYPDRWWNIQLYQCTMLGWLGESIPISDVLNIEKCKSLRMIGID